MCSVSVCSVFVCVGVCVCLRGWVARAFLCDQEGMDY